MNTCYIFRKIKMKGGIHMKAKTLIVMAACMAIGLCASGCQNSMTQTAVAQEDVVHIQIAYENNPGEPLDLACQRWKELLEEQSGGEIQVELYPSSQLGSKSDIINQEIAVVGKVGALWVEGGRNIVKHILPFVHNRHIYLVYSV